MKKAINRKKGTFCLATALAVFFLLFPEKEMVRAALDGKCSDVEACEKEEEKWKELIDQTQQQQVTLQNQMKLMDLQVRSIENDAGVISNDIERNKKEIDRLRGKIDEKNKELEKNKNELSEMLRLYNQMDQELTMEILASGDGMAGVFNQADYLDQASQKVGTILEKLDQKKSELKKRQQEFEEKNNELKEKEEALQEKIYYLNSEKSAKSQILSETQGEERKYQEMLARVEQQKLELLNLDSLSAETSAELNDILKNEPKPKSGLASTSWYYSQKDGSWANKRIGLSSSLMKDYGCAVTSVSMVFTYHGEKISPGKMSSQKVFYRDLIVWPTSWGGVKLESKYGTYHGNISWSKVDDKIEDDQPVIVFVRASGGAGHYVVVHGKDKKGKYVVHDPLFGPNIYLETTMKLVSAVYNKRVTVDQMIIYED